MRLTTTAIALLALLMAAPLLAQDRPTDWTLWATYVDTTNNDLGDGFVMDAESGAGYGLSANFFVSPSFSIEASVFSLEYESELLFEPFSTEDDSGFNMDKVKLVPVTLGLQYHFLKDSKWDLYLGAGGAYVSASDIESDDLDNLGIGSIEVDDEFSWFGNAGLGYRFGKQIGLVLDVRYISYEPTTTSKVTGATEDLDLSPLMASLGIRARF